MPFVLTVGERGSSWAGRPPVATRHDTREEAEAELLDYVERNWDSEMDGEERPEDPTEMIGQYFEVVLERYEIVEASPKATAK
jgi:hypothetical protein